MFSVPGRPINSNSGVSPKKVSQYMCKIFIITLETQDT